MLDQSGVALQGALAVVAFTGQPQNMPIGSAMQLQLADHLRRALPPLGLSLPWRAWGPRSRPTPRQPVPVAESQSGEGQRFDAFQLAKGLCVADVFLPSRLLHMTHVIGFVDGPLPLLFIGLFAVNLALESPGLAANAVAWPAGHWVPSWNLGNCRRARSSS